MSTYGLLIILQLQGHQTILINECPTIKKTLLSSWCYCFQSTTRVVLATTAFAWMLTVWTANHVNSCDLMDFLKRLPRVHRSLLRTDFKVICGKPNFQQLVSTLRINIFCSSCELWRAFNRRKGNTLTCPLTKQLNSNAT